MADGSAESATAYLRWLSVVTRDIVAGSWPQIERVAKELFAHGALDAEEIRAAIYGPGYVFWHFWRHWTSVCAQRLCHAPFLLQFAARPGNFDDNSIHNQGMK